jgi:PhnB protein
LDAAPLAELDEWLERDRSFWSNRLSTRSKPRFTAAVASVARSKELSMQTITPYLLYEDVESALEFLSRAFGFEETLRYTGSAGYINHAEMRYGEGNIMMGDPGDDYRNPKRLGAASVQIYVHVDDVDAVYERARAASAEIIEDIADQEYGARRFGAKDPEGHSWWFAQQIREVAPEDWGAEPARG